MNDSHIKSINMVVDYIQANLDSDLSLYKISRIACLSEFHFSRIFKSVMDETLHQFIKRLRLEKAAGLLLINPDLTITEIALDSGFATSSSFAKSFKNHFKMSASTWRNRSKDTFDKNSTPVQIDSGRLSIIQGSPVWTFKDDSTIRQVVVRDLPVTRVAYIRNVGPYKGDENLFTELYQKLFRWAVPRELLGEDTYTLNIYHDNPEITENKHLRVMAAIPIGKDVKPSGSVGVTEISGGRYGICRFLLKDDEFTEAWDWMSSVWLPGSGYEWDDRESFERGIGERKIDGKRYFDLEICIPVKAK